jgi:hypothetical protein
MDERLARIAIGNAARAASEVGQLAPLLKEHCEPVLHSELELGIGAVVNEIYCSIIEPIFARFPHLKAEFEQNMEKYGKGL